MELLYTITVAPRIRNVQFKKMISTAQIVDEVGLPEARYYIRHQRKNAHNHRPPPSGRTPKIPDKYSILQSILVFLEYIGFARDVI